MKAVILVGGQGARLRPLSLDTKKELMPVANRPFLEHMLAHLARHGVTEAILTTGHMAEAFEGFPPERTHGVTLTLVSEPEALGTCGAVKNVEHVLDDTFLVCNGDILTGVDITALCAFHRENHAVATLYLTPVEDPRAYGLVPIDATGRVERFLEKPRADEIVTDLVNAGVYVLEPEVLRKAPSGRFYMFEHGLFPSLLAEGAPVFGFRSTAYWLDIGTPQKYLRANVDVLERKVGQEPPGERTAVGGWIAEDVKIASTATVGALASVGSSCTIDDGVRIEPLTSVGPGSHVGAEAVVERSVLHAGVTISAGAHVEGSVLGRDVFIGSGARLVDAVIGHGAVVGGDNELRAGIRIWPNLRLPDGSIRFS
jgi:mannose-1-phosphate guanylyltransferase